MGLGFLIVPDSVVPGLQQNGRTTTRVFGSTLVALAATSVSILSGVSRKVQVRVICAHVFFHVVAGVVLAMDWATVPNSPFLPPVGLHVGLTIALVWELSKPQVKVAPE